MKCGGLSLVAFLGALVIAASASAGSAETDATIAAVNSTRTHYRLAALRHSAVLDRSAALKASDIIRCRVFSHTPCGNAFVRTFQQTGYFHGRARVGENLYWGGGSLGTPAAAVAAWLRSAPHRANLLGHGWRDVGVAVVHRPGLFGAGDVWLYVLQFGRH